MRKKIFLITLVITILISSVKAQAATVRVGLLLSVRYAKIYSPGKCLVINPQNNRILKVVQGTILVKVFPTGIKVDQQKFFVSQLKFRPQKGYLYFNRRPYSGDLAIKRNVIGLLNIINIVDLEKYLISVLNCEVSPSWPMEALKAQAVAARTYVIYRKSQEHPEGYDVSASTLDQVYRGGMNFSRRIRRAVNQTKGQVLTYCEQSEQQGSPRRHVGDGSYQGKVIKAYYHSCCGGHTENWEYVFSEGGDYVKGVRCEFCRNAPYMYWKKKYTAYELTKILKKVIDPVGVILAVEIEEIDPSGRVMSLKVKHSKGEISLPGVMFRQLLGFSKLRNTRFSVTPLNLKMSQVTKVIEEEVSITKYKEKFIPSPESYVEIGEIAPVTEKVFVRRKKKVRCFLPQSFLFKGTGSGHGVGMCQWGAKRMAEIGYSYLDILKYYYTGVKIERL